MNLMLRLVSFLAIGNNGVQKGHENNPLLSSSAQVGSSHAPHAARVRPHPLHRPPL